MAIHLKESEVVYKACVPPLPQELPILLASCLGIRISISTQVISTGSGFHYNVLD